MSAAEAPDPLVRRATAKVNLALAVTGRRPDGYHTLRSVFLRLALTDDLGVLLSDDPGGPDRLEVEGDPDCPVEGNLVLRAARQLRDRTGQPFPALVFRLRKRVPVGAGLGGGSSDAAAALDLAAGAWGLRLHPAERLEEALLLGADVPFFAAGHGAALVGGIGEGLEPLPLPGGGVGVLLVTPSVRLATAEVFRTYDAGPSRGAGAAQAVDRLADRLLAGLDGAGLAALASEMRDANDLWPAATSLAPSLPALRASLEAATGRPFLLSGSGPTLFTVYASGAEAGWAADALAASRLAVAVEPHMGLVVTATSSEEEA